MKSIFCFSLFCLLLFVTITCAKFDYKNPVDPDVKKDPARLTSPSDSLMTNDNTPTFNWTAVAQATAYALQVDNNSNFSSPEIDQANITTNTYTSSDTLPDGQYFWRVRTRYGQDAWKDWS